MQKFLLIFLQFALLHPLQGQESYPVFSSKSDSIRFAQLQSDISAYFVPGRNLEPEDREKIDSLFNEQAQLRAKIIGYKTIFKRHPGFTDYAELERGAIAPESVTKLSFAHKKASKLPVAITRCKNLSQLEILNASLAKLPKKLGKLKSLHSIYVYNNSAKLKLTRNKNITGMVIRGTEQKFIPSSFKQFPALDSLDLSRNIGLTAFPDISKNKQIRKLILIENRITLEDLKPGKEIPSLRELYLQRNGVLTVPAAVGNFTGLRKLLFNYNQIHEVDPAIGQLQNLEELSFYQNQLSTIPKGIFELENLVVIDLYFNQIEIAPDALGNLAKLQILYLSNNRISALPESIGNLRDLRELYIHNNRLSYLPESMRELNKLQVLRMNNNQFTTFPEPVLALSQLENLDVSRNNLRYFPKELRGFRSLRILALVNNAWENKEELTSACEVLTAQGTLVHQ